MAYDYGSGTRAPTAGNTTTIDIDEINLILADQSRMEQMRSFYEPTWRDIDRYIDPFGAGGFDRSSTPTFNRDVEDLFDITGIDGLDRYTAAIAGISVPRNQRWHGVRFEDKELMKVANVQRWCDHATDRLFIARYAPGTGFEAQIHEDIRQEGKYGTSPLWVGEKLGHGLFYKTLHMSECFVDEDYCGRIDRVHRLYCSTLRKAAGEFGGIENLSPKSQADWRDEKKRNNEIHILHVVRPNQKFEAGYLGVKGMRFESIYIEINEKHVIRHKGFRSMPIMTSRHITGPRDVYGRSPAMKVLATVKGLQAIGRDILDATNKAVRPPLLFSDDADIRKVATKPDGLTAGGLDEQGRPLVKPLYTGAQIPVGMEFRDQERQVVGRVFLEEVFRLLSDPSDRMTATQVVETLQKEGVLIAPFAGRRETEKLGPMIERELEIMMNARAIDPLPPEVIEAGATPRIIMTNPLSKMARAQEVSGFTRTVEIAVQAAGAGATDALECINFEQGIRDTAEILGARPQVIYSQEEVAQRRADKQAREEAANATQAAPKIAAAALDLTKAGEISQNLRDGGGL